MASCFSILWLTISLLCIVFGAFLKYGKCNENTFPKTDQNRKEVETGGFVAMVIGSIMLIALIAVVVVNRL